MARTIHEEIAELMLDDIMSDPGAAATLGFQRGNLRSGNFDPRYVAWIGQTPRQPGSWSMEQMAAYLKVHAGIMAGLYAKVLISVGATPGPDADREGNAEKLRGVHPAFRAVLDMTQNGADADGFLSWADPIKVEKSTGLGLITSCGTCPVYMPYSLMPHSVPLEVGYTKPSRTYLHLYQEGGVARWAYDDENICLLVNVERVRSARPAEVPQ